MRTNLAERNAESDESSSAARPSLICRVGHRLCALPLDTIVETMRPQPVEAIPGSPAFVMGLAIVRGGIVPVVEAGKLFGDADAPIGRLIVLKAGTRRVGLAVGEVIGIRAVDPRVVDYLPPLIRNADAEVVTAIGRLDAEMLVVLEAARIVPDELLELLEARGQAT